MREIKFRAWDGTQMYTPIIGQDGEMFRDYRDVEDFNPAPHDDLMQYTGLKDKNGTDIYEGDILQDDYGAGEVEWVQEHCTYMVFTRNPNIYLRLESDAQLSISEVIGNIYENKELITHD